MRATIIGAGTVDCFPYLLSIPLFERISIYYPWFTVYAQLEGHFWLERLFFGQNTMAGFRGKIINSNVPMLNKVSIMPLKNKRWIILVWLIFYYFYNANGIKLGSCWDSKSIYDNIIIDENMENDFSFLDETDFSTLVARIIMSTHLLIWTKKSTQHVLIRDHMINNLWWIFKTTLNSKVFSSSST